jgi:hypothetical protein
MLSKGLFFWGVALLVGAQALQADFSYEQELYTPAGQGEPPRTTRILGFISGLKARAEDHSSKVPNVILTRLDQGVIRLVDLPKKAYIEMPIPGMKEEQAQPFPVTATRTTQSKKIGPYQCTRFEVRLAASTLNLWLSTDIDLPSDDVSTYWQAGTRLYPVTLTRQLAKLPGFPVRVEVVSQGVSVVTTVTGVTKQEVPAFLFEVPLDFQQGLAVQAPPEPPPQPPPPKGSKP